MKRATTVWVSLLAMLVATSAFGKVSPTNENGLAPVVAVAGLPITAAGSAGQTDRVPASPLASEDTAPGQDASLTSTLGPMDSASILEVPSTYATIQDAISAAAGGDTIVVAAGSYTETGQIVIDKNLTIIGAGAGITTIKPAGNTGSSGDARGWFLVQSGVTFNLSAVTLDGQGKSVYQAVRSFGNGTIRFCEIRNIYYSKYIGMGVSLFGNVTVENCAFENNERIGVIAFGTGCTSSVIAGCTYKGKGVGDWIDYAVEVGGGAAVSILNCRISDCLGVASSDGSASAGILVTDYYGPGTAATITGSLIANCTTGIHVGYNDADASTVTASYNNVAGNVWGGVACTGTANSVNAENNWWGTLDSSFAATMVSSNVDIDPILLTSQIDLVRMGARLVALQNNDGGWDWPLDDGNPANASPLNTIGPIAMGLAKAYRATGDAAMLAALQQSSALLLAKTNNFSPSDGYLAAELDDVLGVTSHVAHLNANFYGPLAAGTYNRSGAGTLYGTAAYVNLIRTSRQSQGIGNLGAWDVAMGLVAAAACGVGGDDLGAWIDGVKGEIDELDGDASYDVIGLAGALYGLAVVGEEFDPTAGEHEAASSLADLAAILAGYQLSTGGFTWNSGYVVENDDNETIQETAYAVLALNEIGGYAAEIAKAINYLQSVQLANGGWKSWAGGGENNEITAEGGWAVSLGNRLELNVTEPSLYIKTTETAILDLDVANLLQKVTGLQAVLNFSSMYFQSGTGQVNVVAGGGLWNDLIYTQWTTGGDLDVAVGIEMEQLTSGTEADATTAVITLTPTGTEGTTRMVFRPDVSDVESTLLASILSTAVSPNKVDSVWIVIDGTPPTVDTFAADPLCTKTTTTLTFTVSDNLAGVDYVDVYVDGSKVAEDVTSPYVLDMSGYATGCYAVTIKVVDKAGNEADSSAASVCVDKTAPAISNIAAEQDGSDVLCPAVAVQGVVDIYVDVTDAGCAALVVPPTVTVGTIGAAAYVDVSGDTYHYQVTVGPATANGAHIITVNAADALGNSSSDNSKSICVDKNQITGTVELESLAPPAGGLTRTVTFVATGGVKKTWSIPVAFIQGSTTGTYTLTQVPAGTTALSAKSDWNLRRKVAAVLDGNNQASADFTGAAMLLGGDINGSNSINILDYSAMKISWGAGTVGDINGDGSTWLSDYSIMKSNWFKLGDAE